VTATPTRAMRTDTASSRVRMDLTVGLRPNGWDPRSRDGRTVL